MAEEVTPPAAPPAAEVAAAAPAAAEKRVKRKGKKNILNGVVHIQSTFNNTIITITDVSGNVISWSSAGARPGDDVPRDVGDGDDGVVEGALDVHHAVEDVLLALPLDALLGGCGCRGGDFGGGGGG